MANLSSNIKLYGALNRQVDSLRIEQNSIRGNLKEGVEISPTRCYQYDTFQQEDCEHLEPLQESIKSCSRSKVGRM